MIIEVRLYATFRRYCPAAAGGVLTLELPEDSMVIAAAEALGIPCGEIHLAMVNGVTSDLDRGLAAGDRVGLFPPIGRG